MLCCNRIWSTKHKKKMAEDTPGASANFPFAIRPFQNPPAELVFFAFELFPNTKKGKCCFMRLAGFAFFIVRIVGFAIEWGKNKWMDWEEGKDDEVAGKDRRQKQRLEKPNFGSVASGKKSRRRCGQRLMACVCDSSGTSNGDGKQWKKALRHGKGVMPCWKRRCLAVQRSLKDVPLLLLLLLLFWSANWLVKKGKADGQLGGWYKSGSCYCCCVPPAADAIF